MRAVDSISNATPLRGLAEFFLSGRLIERQMMVVEIIVVLAWDWLCHGGIHEFHKIQHQHGVGRKRLTLREKLCPFHAGCFQRPSPARHLRDDGCDSASESLPQTAWPSG